MDKKTPWVAAQLCAALWVTGCGDETATTPLANPPFGNILGTDGGAGFGGDGAVVAPNGPPFPQGTADDGGTGITDSGDGWSAREDGGQVDVTPSDHYTRGPAPTRESSSKDGPYEVASIASGYLDGANYLDGTLYYPTDAEPPFASVSVCPGFVSPQLSIQEWGPFLASHGIVTMTIGTNFPTDVPSIRAQALLDALASIRAENTRENSPLKGQIDEGRQAVIGWSMGGGGAMLAAEQVTSLRAVIGLASWNPAHNYQKVQSPTLLFAAVGDSLAGGQSQGFYETIPASVSKLFWEVPDSSLFFSGHDLFNTPYNFEGTVGRFGLSWLKTFLEGDTRYRPFLLEEPSNATDFRTNLN